MHSILLLSRGDYQEDSWYLLQLTAHFLDTRVWRYHYIRVVAEESDVNGRGRFRSSGD